MGTVAIVVSARTIASTIGPWATDGTATAAPTRSRRRSSPEGPWRPGGGHPWRGTPRGRGHTAALAPAVPVDLRGAGTTGAIGLGAAPTLRGRAGPPWWTPLAVAGVAVGIGVGEARSGVLSVVTDGTTGSCWMRTGSELMPSTSRQRRAGEGRRQAPAPRTREDDRGRVRTRVHHHGPGTCPWRDLLDPAAILDERDGGRVSTSTFGRPTRLPLALARATLAATRSVMSARSNSATHASSV